MARSVKATTGASLCAVLSWEMPPKSERKALASVAASASALVSWGYAHDRRENRFTGTMEDSSMAAGRFLQETFALSTQSSSYQTRGSNPDDLADWSASGLLEAYSRKTVSPVDVTKAVIARIDAWEPRLQALYAFDPDAALRDARASEMRWMSGEARALDGVPATIKENIATKGTPVPLGTAARPLVPAAEDAPAAARLREDGVVILAKTTMPDYGMLSSGLSSFHPLARNPWDLSKNPGGSSAGAGAAAAAGYGP